MNKTQGWVALIVLGFATATPASLYARSSKHPEVPNEVQKSSKQYNKELRKQQKQTAKLQKKHTKQNEKRVQRTHTVT